MDLTTIFITGLFAGGLTCLAVQGGLLASSLAKQEEDVLVEKSRLTGELLPILSFLAARLVVYTILGLLLGAAGSVFQLSINARIILQLGASVFMIGVALSMLDVHPIFRYFIIQPPKSLTRLVKNQSRSKAVFGPAILGAMTIFIPCGATQAMMIYAMSTGSAVAGALTMFVFIIGTSPLFVVLGFVFKKAGTSMGPLFNRLAAAALIFVALYNINGAIALSGSNLTLENAVRYAYCDVTICDETAPTFASPVDRATIGFTQSGYVSDPVMITVKSGTEITLDLVNKTGTGCIQAFTIPKLGLQKVVGLNESAQLTFTAPAEKGQLAFMCSMGMYRGVINII